MAPRRLCCEPDGGDSQRFRATRFNISELAGSAAAAAISNTYHPAAGRNVPNTMESWATMMGWDAVSDLLKEFWPDIRRKLHQRKE